MSAGTGSRGELARRQTELVAALTGGGRVPNGFDPTRVRALAAALQEKRARELARAWPRLARALGDAWASAIASHMCELPAPPLSGPLGDGRALARSLAARGRLPWEGRLELLANEVRWRWGPDGNRSPRRFGAGAATQRHPPRLCLALRAPGLGLVWWQPIR
jgi:hypothetical protein